MNYEVKSPRLVKILQDRKEILDQSRDLLDEKERIEKELAKLGYKMNKLKERTAPFIEKDKLKDIKFEEFDYIARIFIEDDKAFIEVKNQVEDYIESLREKNNEQK